MRIPVGTVLKTVRTKDGRFTSLWSKTCKVAAAIWYWTKIATGFSVIAVAAFVYGTGVMTNEVYAENIPVQTHDTLAPVMQRIADCESGDRLPNGRAVPGSARQFKNGKLVTHSNADGSLDLGYMEINVTAAHLNEAAKQGLDLTKEEDNKKFGLWIYTHEGTGPWNSSFSCWQ